MEKVSTDRSRRRPFVIDSSSSDDADTDLSDFEDAVEPATAASAVTAEGVIAAVKPAEISRTRKTPTNTSSKAKAVRSLPSLLVMITMQKTRLRLPLYLNLGAGSFLLIFPLSYLCTCTFLRILTPG